MRRRAAPTRSLRSGRVGPLAALAGAVVLLSACGAGAPRTGPSPTATGPAGFGSMTGSTSSSAPSRPPSSGPPPDVVTVAGRQVLSAGLTDVASAARRAGVTPPDGRLLSVATGRVLDAHLSPAHVFVDGRPAALTSAVHAGDVVTFARGRDRVEATKTVSVPVTLSSAATALYRSVTPGSGEAVVGSVSGEQAGLVVTRAPAVGRLRSSARVAMTFDDGPSAGYTSDVVQLVTRHGVPAVFCDIGVNAQKYPALVRAEVGAGARLCDHTQTHPLNLPALSPQRIVSEIHQGAASVSAAGGVAPLYFRPPGGHTSAYVDRVARAAHLAPMLWTVDPRDWSRPGTQTIVLRVLDQLRPDGIVLMHDGGGDRSQTVAALRILLPELAAAGWTFSFPAWVH